MAAEGVLYTFTSSVWIMVGQPKTVSVFAYTVVFTIPGPGLNSVLSAWASVKVPSAGLFTTYHSTPLVPVYWARTVKGCPSHRGAPWPGMNRVAMRLTVTFLSSVETQPVAG